MTSTTTGLIIDESLNAVTHKMNAAILKACEKHDITEEMLLADGHTEEIGDMAHLYHGDTFLIAFGKMELELTENRLCISVKCVEGE